MGKYNIYLLTASAFSLNYMNNRNWMFMYY